MPDDPFFDEDGDIPDDDEELVETPTDVVEALGFDPKDGNYIREYRAKP